MSKIGFVGAGRMATALASGLLAKGLVDRSSLIASDPLTAATARFAEVTGARTTTKNLEVVEASDTVVLSIKPQQVREVLGELRGRVDERHLVVSIVTGTTLAAMAEALGRKARLVRVVPNTPCLVGRGTSAYCLGPAATAADAKAVAEMLEAVGRAFPLDEKLLDTATGLAGSGPAFVYVLIEALADGGVRMGLPRDTAGAMAAQTVLGAAAMVLETGEHPAALKDAVASPGGTTIAGLASLEAAGVRGAMIAAVEAATRRAIELREM